MVSLVYLGTIDAHYVRIEHFAICVWNAFGMLVLNGLPRPHHPQTNMRCFDAIDDKFFISIEAVGPRFDLETAQAFLAQHGGTKRRGGGGQVMRYNLPGY